MALTRIRHYQHVMLLLLKRLTSTITVPRAVAQRRRESLVTQHDYTGLVLYLTLSFRVSLSILILLQMWLCVECGRERRNY